MWENPYQDMLSVMGGEEGRLLTWPREAPAFGNTSRYQQWALETAGVGAAKVLLLWDGAGAVKVRIAPVGTRLAGRWRRPVRAVLRACAGWEEIMRGTEMGKAALTNR